MFESRGIFSAYISVIMVDYLGARIGFTNAYYMVADSNKFLAFIVGCFAFLFFKI